MDGVVLAVDRQDRDAARARAPPSRARRPSRGFPCWRARSSCRRRSRRARRRAPRCRTRRTARRRRRDAWRRRSGRRRRSKAVAGTARRCRAQLGRDVRRAPRRSPSPSCPGGCARPARRARRVLAGRERDDAQPIGMRVDDRQRALADRSGRAEDRDALSWRSRNLQVADEDVVHRRRRRASCRCDRARRRGRESASTNPSRRRCA